MGKSMKKILLSAALLFASYGAFADDYDDFVHELRNKLGEVTKNLGGPKAAVRADKPHRIVFIDFWMPDDLRRTTPEEDAEIRRTMIEQFKNDDSADAIRELNVTLVYNYISKKGRIVSVVISSADL